jgi:glutamine synthetase
MSQRDLPNAGMTTLAPTRLHALAAFDEDPLVEEVLGAEFKEIFLSQKTDEWTRDFFRVSEEQCEKILAHI